MRFTFTSLLLLAFDIASSQSALTLDDCLNYAYEHNFEIQESANIIDKSRLDLKQSYLNTLPTLNAEYNHYLSSGRSLNVETYTWDNEDIQQGNMALSTELVVFNGLYNLYAQQAGRIAVEKTAFELQQKKLLLGLDIILLFHKISLNNSNIAVLTLTCSGTKEEINNLEEQINAGTMAKSNIYELQAQAKKEELEILSLNNQNEKYFNNLEKLINWNEGVDLQIEADNLIISQDSLIPQKIEINKIIDQSVITFATKKETDLALKTIQIKKSDLFPKISANASLSSRYLKDALDPASGELYTYQSQLGNNQYKQLVLTLSIPIINRCQKANDIKRSYIEYENKKLQFQNAQYQLKTELENIVTDISYLNKKLLETKQMVETYKMSHEVAIEKYRAGILNAYAVNISKNNFTASSLQLNRQQTELSMNIQLLNLYCEYTVK